MRRHVVWLVAVAAVVGWLPFVRAPLSPDEGGFLLVSSQWRTGGSLYGHYWVDRPPLLIGIFDIASTLGGAVALRLIGMAVVVVSIVLTERIARVATGRATVVPAIVTGALLTTPLFGTGMVNGELLAVPFVLAGILAALRAWTSATPRSWLWALAAGSAGAAAPLVKQNVVDVVVVAGVLVLQGLRRSERRRTLGLVLAGTVGAIATIAVVLVWAAARGTAPAMLWDAIFTFRGEAASVIHASSTDSTFARFLELLEAAALSGAPVLLVVMLLRLRGHVQSDGAPDLRFPALLLLLWEIVAVAAGGSYWLHYLIGLVPGLTLLSVAAAQRPPRLHRWTAAAVSVACVSAAVATVVTAVNVPIYSADAAVSAYLRAHSTRGDTVVVGFGHPDIVWDAGLTSPYQYLWSLPVRVRDPRLQQLTQVLSGPSAPTWVVVNGTSLATWGVDATAAQGVLEERYRPATRVDDYVVWELAGPS